MNWSDLSGEHTQEQDENLHDREIHRNYHNFKSSVPNRSISSFKRYSIMYAITFESKGDD